MGSAPPRALTCCRRVFGLGLAMLAAGCQTGGWSGSGTPPVRDDIVAIRQFYATEPWIRDEEGRVSGLFVRVYFVAAVGNEAVGKGVFVPGTIKAALYTLTVRPDGSYDRQPVYEWSFDEQQAAGFRLRTPSVMGYSYGLILRWPPEVNVMGREIQVVLSYEKQDGKVVTARGTRFRVPLPAGTRPAPPAGPPRRTARPGPPADLSPPATSQPGPE